MVKVYVGNCHYTLVTLFYQQVLQLYKCSWCICSVKCLWCICSVKCLWWICSVKCLLCICSFKCLWCICSAKCLWCICSVKCLWCICSVKCFIFIDHCTLPYNWAQTDLTISWSVFPTVRFVEATPTIVNKTSIFAQWG